MVKVSKQITIKLSKRVKLCNINFLNERKVLQKRKSSGLETDLYAGILIGDWDQTFALDITQKLSVFCLFHFVVFVSVSKLFKNENLQS